MDKRWLLSSSLSPLLFSVSSREDSEDVARTPPVLLIGRSAQESQRQGGAVAGLAATAAVRPGHVRPPRALRQ